MNNLPSILRPDPRPYRDWSSLELELLWNAAHSDYGDAVIMEDGPDKDFWVPFCETTIADVKEERARRARARQPERATAAKEARGYPPDFLKHIKAVYDLRDVVARDIQCVKSLDTAICSPLRSDDDSPSFRVYADHFYDYGTGEGGDVFSWRMRWHGVLFLQAVESLAVEADIELPEIAKPKRTGWVEL